MAEAQNEIRLNSVLNLDVVYDIQIKSKIVKIKNCIVFSLKFNLKSYIEGNQNPWAAKLTLAKVVI